VGEPDKKFGWPLSK